MNEKELINSFKKFKKREKKTTTIAIMMSLIPLIFGILWIWFTYTKVNKLNIQSQLLTEQILNKKIELDSIIKLRDKIQLEYLEAKGFNKDKSYSLLTQAINADKILKQLRTKGTININTRIQYYRKTLDQDKVWLAIKELGYIHLEDIQSRSEMDDIETNCIAYGQEVSVYDLKLVLLTLIRAGFKIQEIKPFKNQINKEYLIQIVGIKYVNGSTFDKTPISIDKIFNAKTSNDLIW